MAFTILSIIAGIIAVIPAILKRMDVAQQVRTNEGVQRAKQDSHLLDTVLPPQ